MIAMIVISLLLLLVKTIELWSDILKWLKND